MKKLLLLFIGGLLLVASVLAAPTPTVYEYRTDTHNLVTMDNINDISCTKFIPDETADVNTTSMNFGTIVGSPTATGKIYSHNAGTNKPDALLKTFSDITITNGWKNFTSATSYTLIDGTTYWACVDCTGCSVATHTFKIRGAETVGQNNHSDSTDAGASWTTIAFTSNLIVYGVSPPVNTFSVNVDHAYNLSNLENANVSFYYKGIRRNTTLTSSAGIVTFTTINMTITVVNVTITKDNFFNETIMNMPANTTSGVNLTMTRWNITNAYEKVTNSLIAAPYNCTTLGGRTYNNCLNVALLNTSTTITLNKTGYFGTLKNITPTSSPSNNQFNVTGVYNTVLNVTAINNVTKANINTFAGWVYNSTYAFNESFSTTTGVAFVNLTQGRYLVHVTATGYSQNYTSEYVAIVTTNHSVIFELYTSNSVNVVFRKESDGTLITNNNITIVISGPSSEVTNYSNQATSVFFSGLDEGVYTFKFSNVNYTLRAYVVTVGANTSQLLTAYLSPANSTVLFTIKDENSLKAVEGALVGFYRYVGGVYSLVESHNTDVTGKTEFTYTYGVKYAITISKTGYETKTFTLDPILFNSYDVYLTPTTSEEQSYNDVAFYFTPKVYYKNMTNAFTILFNSPDGILTSYWVNLTYPGGTNEQTGANANGGSFSHTVNASTATIFSTVNITVNYTTVFGESYQYSYKYSIIGSYAKTLISLKTNHYGLGVFERVLIGTLITVGCAGLATLAAGSGVGLGFGFIILLILSYLELMPWVATAFAAFLTVMILMKRSGDVQ